MLFLKWDLKLSHVLEMANTKVKNDNYDMLLLCIFLHVLKQSRGHFACVFRFLHLIPSVMTVRSAANLECFLLLSVLLSSATVRWAPACHSMPLNLMPFPICFYAVHTALDGNGLHSYVRPVSHLHQDLAMCWTGLIRIILLWLICKIDELFSFIPP